MFSMRSALLLAMIVTVMPVAVSARPLSYPGGTMFMTENNGEENAVDIDYTITPRTAFAYHVAYQRDDDSVHNALQMNNLIWRGNFPDSQANIYSKIGAGVSSGNGDADSLVYGGVMADWEDRRFYTAYGNEYEVIDGNGEFTQMGRVGIAPYIGGAGDLHTWVILQADHRPEHHKPIEITPLVRLFKGTNLIEVGYSTQNNFLLNYTHQF